MTDVINAYFEAGSLTRHESGLLFPCCGPFFVPSHNAYRVRTKKQERVIQENWVILATGEQMLE